MTWKRVIPIPEGPNVEPGIFKSDAMAGHGGKS
jgi:hypothetical protein